MLPRIIFFSTLLILCFSATGSFCNSGNRESTNLTLNSGDTLIGNKIAHYDPHSPLTIIPCESANIFCTGTTYSFPSGNTGTAPFPVGGYPYYGCIGLTTGPAWYYMQVGVAGNIIITITQTKPPPLNNQLLDVDFVCWGPFTSVSDGCATGLTASNVVDCSFSPSSVEICHILNAQVGQIYILLMTNFSMQQGVITFSQTGGNGQTNCNPVFLCSVVALTATASACNPTTNNFSISGSVDFTNPPSTGTLTVTDNTAVPPVVQTFNPPFISPKAYNLTNIPCDGLTHSITAAFSDSSACTLTQQLTAPPGICPLAVISGGGTICNDGTSLATVNVNISGSVGPYTFIYAINGINQTPVSNYSGPLPYQISTSIPGTYTMVSVNSLPCPWGGSVSGSATVALNPLPTAGISGSTGVCLNAAPPPVTFTGGSSSPPYTFTYNINGGTSQVVSTTTGNSVMLQVPTTIAGTFIYNLLSVQDGSSTACSQIQTGSANITVNPLPTAVIAGTASVCQGAPSPKITFIAGSSAGPWMFTYKMNGGPDQTISTVSGNSITLDVPTNTSGIFTYTLVSIQDLGSGCSQVQPGNATVTVNPLPTAAISGTTTVCQNSTPPVITFTGGAAIAPYTFTYNINGGTNQSVTTTTGNSVSVPATISTPGVFTWNLVGVQDGNSTACSQLQTGIAVITVLPSPYVNLTACNDPATTTTSRTFVLKGGVPPGGQYYIDGIIVPGALLDPAGLTPGNHQITYSFTSYNTCTNTSSTSPLSVISGSSPAICPQNITDPRDSRTYKANKLGTYCWMLTNLNYGTRMSFSSQPQSDNCIPEKYCLPTDANCSSYGGLYQWEELMQYQVPGPGQKIQGLCPPEWHVPSQSEWQDLINAVASEIPGEGIAGGFLKDSIPTFGFHALAEGVFYLNYSWAFTSGSPLVTMFWTATTNGPYRAVARGMNTYNYSVSFYPSLRENAFPVRCVKD